jgi:hypothetical protein
MSELPEKKENFNAYSSNNNDTISFIGSNLPGGSYNNYWDDDGFSLTGNPYASPDVFSFGGTASSKDQEIKNTPPNTNGFWKYSEDETLKVVEQYLSSTYHGHYTSENSKVQVLDIIEAIGDGVPFCRDNLIKYSSRFGKKNGTSKLDALKIIHYAILLYHFSGFHTETKNNNETF